MTTFGIIVIEIELILYRNGISGLNILYLVNKNKIQLYNIKIKNIIKTIIHK